ncbi:MAG: hypothetical protein HUJ75_07145 [Parasporobacterium sp.]|nr:hypothetical protein [Parasporobacterium sp.]
MADIFRNTPERIPVDRMIDQVDRCFAVNDMEGAGRVLENWRREALRMNDKAGELSVVSEMLGYYRKILDEANALEAIDRAEVLLRELHMDHGHAAVSAATIRLNMGTTSKAFGLTDQALRLYSEAGTVLTAQLSPDDMLLAGFYNNYAIALAEKAAELMKEGDAERICTEGPSDNGDPSEPDMFYKKAEELFEKALVIDKANSNYADGAITYTNMADMYFRMFGDEDPHYDGFMQKAMELLEDPAAVRDSYYAFVTSKCADTFDFFGYFGYAAELRERSDKIYKEQR